MKKFFLLCLFGQFLSYGAFAQESAEKTEIKIYKNEFGFNVGSSTGVGFSYRHWGDRFGVQATLLPYKERKEMFISSGITGLFTLNKTQWVRTFLYWGNHLLVNDEQYYVSSYTDSNGYVQNVYDTRNKARYITGFGMGFSLGRVVAFNISFGYGAYDLFSGFDNVSFLPTGEMGLYWKF